MTRREHQSAFVVDIMLLIHKAHELGYDVTFGEFWRTPEQQQIYVKTGRSKTMESDHLIRCGADLNFFKNGVLIRTPYELGKYWESLSEYNRWGGSWRGKIEAGKSNFKDDPHFERHVK